MGSIPERTKEPGPIIQGYTVGREGGEETTPPRPNKSKEGEEEEEEETWEKKKKKDARKTLSLPLPFHASTCAYWEKAGNIY